MPEIEIFRAGTHTAANGQTITFSQSDLEEIASGYNPEYHEAPIVLGHPADNAPAYGWVKGLRVAGDRLFATLGDLSTSFVEAVRDKLYKKVSASFYPPESPANPNPGRYSLRHLGFLGAQPPAVKGLSPISLSEMDELDQARMVLTSLLFSAQDDSIEFEDCVDCEAIDESEIDEDEDEDEPTEFADKSKSKKSKTMTAEMEMEDDDEEDEDDEEDDEEMMDDPEDMGEGYHKGKKKKGMPVSMKDCKGKKKGMPVSLGDSSCPDCKDKKKGSKKAAGILYSETSDTEVTQLMDATIEARLKELEQRERAIALKESALLRSELASFCETDLKGKITPAIAPTEDLVDFMVALQKQDESLSFSEGDSTLLDWFKGFLGRLPQQVNFSEVVKPSPIEYSEVNPSVNWDKESVELDRRIKAYCKENGKDPSNSLHYAEAMTELGVTF